ncbi:RNA-splicing factor [Coemansia sp. RSA 1813]|nr:RNA-splicing factor [Coemansia sp. RSA 1646]KAJ1765156.1 RNA-splicing factor [Coemansia sp. RSA 1843]KAJ2085576.1 RNA-splicing factor [Coemansia sp. RSA 986]KAJ2211050.1 RNA-splicing factor [Coemansia sp. RSA 487]KAJ2562943.1 RNA-splicing factor [Coemansia sp. RSA 1813]
MYNGIGLTTPRGSGTSGHVVRNASALKSGQERSVAQNRLLKYSGESPPRSKPVDKGILEHEQKRQAEVKCLELQDELEEKGLDDAEIEKRVDRFRRQLLENIDHLDLSSGKSIKSFEIQKIAAAKSKENHRMAAALHVEEGYMEGAAFDRELQELKRQKRLLERERDRASRRECGSSRQHRHHRYHGSQGRHSGSRSNGSGAEVKSDSCSDTERRHTSSKHDRRHGSHRTSHRSGRDRSQSPMKASVRTVEDGEPGEIEDIVDENSTSE